MASLAEQAAARRRAAPVLTLSSTAFGAAGIFGLSRGDVLLGITALATSAFSVACVLHALWRVGACGFGCTAACPRGCGVAACL